MTNHGRRSGGLAPTNLVSGIEYNPLVEATEQSPSGFPAGTPVITSPSATGAVVPGRASAISTSQVIGIAAATGVAGQRVIVQRHGVLTLTEAQWARIVNPPPHQRNRNLVPGNVYYLDPGSAEGLITQNRTALSGEVVVKVGLALSPTDLLIQLCSPQIVT